MRQRIVPALLVLTLATLAATRAGADCSPLRGDIAPGILDTTASPPIYRVVGDGAINVSDVVVMLRQSVGLHNIEWTSPGPDCDPLPGDVAPGDRIGATVPPLWRARGDGRRDIGDVIILLRLSVGLEIPDDSLTYWKDAKVILDAKCATCHVTGGLGPFPLTTYAEALPEAPFMRDAIATLSMPPWPPDPACNEYLHPRALIDAHRETLLAWIDTGAREGNPLDEPPPLVRVPPITYDVAMPLTEPYTPNDAAADDYRCFVIEWPLPAESYVTGFRVTPDRDDMVHHVIAYAIAPFGVPEIEQLDANEAGPGYTCFGGPGGPDGAARWVGAWAPGTEGGAFPADTGIRVPAGSVMVVQIHYNMDNGAPGPDLSVLDFRTASTVARPAAVLLMAEDNFTIAAGDPSHAAVELAPASSVVGAARFEIGGGINDPIVLHGAGLHMHQLGTEIDLNLVRTGGGGEECLLDIPAWDFHWQGSYDLTSPVTVQMTDEFRLRCTWDNSPANQPFVGGVQLDPVVVRWGEGTRDEMCLGVMYVTAP